MKVSVHVSSDLSLRLPDSRDSADSRDTSQNPKNIKSGKSFGHVTQRFTEKKEQLIHIYYTFIFIHLFSLYFYIFFKVTLDILPSNLDILLSTLDPRHLATLISCCYFAGDPTDL